MSNVGLIHRLRDKAFQFSSDPILEEAATSLEITEGYYDALVTANRTIANREHDLKAAYSLIADLVEQLQEATDGRQNEVQAELLSVQRNGETVQEYLERHQREQQARRECHGDAHLCESSFVTKTGYRPPHYPLEGWLKLKEERAKEALTRRGETAEETRRRSDRYARAQVEALKADVEFCETESPDYATSADAHTRETLRP